MTTTHRLHMADVLALIALALAAALGLWTLYEAFVNSAVGTRAVAAYIGFSLIAGLATLAAQSGTRLKSTLPSVVKWGWVAVSALLIWAIIRTTFGAIHA